MSGVLKAKHLLPVLQACDPETEIIIGVYLGMPQVMVNGDLVVDKGYAVTQLNTTDRGTTLSLSNAVATDNPNGDLVYPSQPQINSFSVDTTASAKEMQKQINEQNQPTQSLCKETFHQRHSDPFHPHPFPNAI